MTPQQIKKKMDKILESYYGEPISAESLSTIKAELDECLDKYSIKLDFDIVSDYTHLGMVELWPNDELTEQYFCKMCRLGKTP